MLRRISIKNFRSHEHTVLDFHPGVNAIIGRGQAGKSNVKRAMEWVNDNRPLGSKFMSWWANGEPTEVVLDVDNPDGAHTVTMTKGGTGSATYSIMGPGWREPSTFEKVGTKVPDPVRRVLNMGVVNMQAQLDQPYLVAGNKGDISRAVNRVIQAEAADRWLSELNSRTLSTNQLLKALEVTIEQQQVQVSRMAALPTAEDYLIKAELVDNKLGVASRRAQGIAGLVQECVQADATVDRWAGIVGPLEELVKGAEAAQEAIQEAHVTCGWIDSLWELEAHIADLSAKYQRRTVEYVELLDVLGQCPTCLSPVDSEVITRLKEEL